MPWGRVTYFKVTDSTGDAKGNVLIWRSIPVAQQWADSLGFCPSSLLEESRALSTQTGLSTSLCFRINTLTLAVFQPPTCRFLLCLTENLQWHRASQIPTPRTHNLSFQWENKQTNKEREWRSTGWWEEDKRIMRGQNLTAHYTRIKNKTIKIKKEWELWL